MQVKYDSLNDSDLYIWSYITKNREECTRLTIEELGKKCSVSRTTILRFAKKLELEGYSELKYYIRKDADLAMELPAGRTIDLERLLHNYMVMLSEVKNKNFKPVCELIEHAGRIIVVGTGTVQRLVAQELQRGFMRFGVLMTVVCGHSEIGHITEWVKEDDLVIMISLSGESSDITTLAKELHVKNVPMISITRMASNTIARLADQPIYVFSDEVPMEGDTVYMSTTMFFSVIEILCIRYFNYIQLKEIKSGKE